MPKTHLFVLLLLAFFLNACTTVSPRPIQSEKPNHWHIKGKMAAISATDSATASFDWVQNNDHYTLVFMGPLGTSALKVEGQPGKVMLTAASGKRYYANNPEALIRAQLGFDIPVSNLHYWIQGQPVPGVPANPQYNAAHQLVALTQNNWHVQFLDYSQRGDSELPNKIFISRAPVKVKIIIY